MKKLSILLALAFMAVMATTAVAQTASIALIDYPKCIRLSEGGKRANNEMKTIEDRWAPRIEALRTDIGKLENEYIAKEKVLTEAAKKAQIDEIQKKRIEHDTQMRQFQTELENKERELTNKIFDDLEKIVEAYAKEKKYNLILHTQSVVYNQGFPDISDEIIARYDKSLGR